MLFSINCVEKISMDEIPTEERSKVGECDYKLYKGLKSKRYFFNDFYKHDQEISDIQRNTRRILDKNFFGPHINVQAVVGENGSGKSSLMELIYIAINNFSYMFERGHDEDRPGADPLYYVPGLFVRIYFSFGNVVYKLESKGLVVDLFCEKENKAHFEIDTYGNDNLMSEEAIADLVDHFFYTIVSNYSLQSFIPTNYIHDVYVFESGRDRKIKKEDATNTIWINSIFHKNDGYIRSIVLNPYRDNGLIDISNELSLSKDRVCALFLWFAQNGTSFFKPYEYYNLKLKLKVNCLKNKIKKIWKLSGSEQAYFDKCYPDDSHCLNMINPALEKKLVREFLLSPEFIDGSCDEYKKKAMLYLQLKIVTIVNKYDVFLDYKDVVVFEKNIEEPKIIFVDGEKANQLIEMLKEPDWHVTKKIRRVTSFMKLPKDAIKRIFNSRSVYNGELYFDELSDVFFDQNFLYSPFIGAKKIGGRRFVDPVRINRILPPSIFEYELVLKRDGNVINLNELSSGELQLMQTLSIHSYHIENVLSIKKEYETNGKIKYHPKYQYINLIFDEVEMCFHPDYQRQFLMRLLELITTMKQNWYGNGGCCLNIIIITHSPFILSDIPNSNILYLQEGEEVDGGGLITFGSNISDMLYHSFFLGNQEKGFIGEFAKRKIESLADFFAGQVNESNLNSNATPEWTEEWANIFLESVVGDEMIKTVLRQIKES